MPSLRSGRLYARFIALFLLMVVFSSIILAGVTGYFSLKNEDALYTRIEENTETVTKRLSSDILTLFDLCGLVAENSIIQENFRPYEVLKLNQKYYSNDIVDLLWQCRLQFSGLIESVFLYADNERVLYSANENGMTSGDTFFSRIMLYEKMKKEDWLSLLERKNVGISILPPDSYSTVYVSDSHAVIPIAYRFVNHGYSNVLIMNISLKKMCALYEANAIMEQSSFSILDNTGNWLYGEDNIDYNAAISASDHVFISGEKYYVYSSPQQTLSINIFCLTPRSELLKMTNSFHYLIFALPMIFALCGALLAIILSRKMYEPFRIVHESMPQSTGNDCFQNELEAIKSSIASLAEDRQTYLNKSREHLNHYISQTLANLLSNRTLDNEAYFAQIMNSEYGFVKSSYRVIDVLFDISSSSGYLTIHETMKNFAQIIEEVFSVYGPFVRIRYEENMYVLVLADNGPCDSDIRLLCENFSKRIAEISGLSASVRYGIGHCVPYYSELSESFEAANSAVLALPPPNGWTDVPLHEEEFHYDQRDVIRALSSCDVRLIEETCGEILNSAKRCGVPYNITCSVLRDICHTAMTLQKKLSSNCLLPVESVDPLPILLLSPEINIAPLISMLLPYIPRLSIEKNDDGMERITRKIMLYIDSNYTQDVSLDILADYLGLSAKYVSRVFKVTMNVKLSDYLAHVRIEKAKELLLMEQPLERIAEQVGITNRTTFTRIFRKLEGVTPSEWRRIHRDRITLAPTEKEDNE